VCYTIYKVSGVTTTSVRFNSNLILGIKLYLHYILVCIVKRTFIIRTFKNSISIGNARMFFHVCFFIFLNRKLKLFIFHWAKCRSRRTATSEGLQSITIVSSYCKFSFAYRGQSLEKPGKIPCINTNVPMQIVKAVLRINK